MRNTILYLLFFTAAVPRAGAQFCKPEITTLNGLAVNIGPADTNGDGLSDQPGVEMRVSDFLLDAKSPCNNLPLTITITKNGQSAPGAATSVFFNLTELGTQIVRIWAVDSEGNTDFAETYVIVQDNDNWESQPPRPMGCDPDVVPPTIVMYNGLSAAFIPNGAGSAEIQVVSAQFLRRFSDNCDPAAGARPRTVKSVESTGLPPAQASRDFECDFDFGVSLVELWMKDKAGNYGWTQSYCIGQENATDYCVNTIQKGCAPDLIPPAVALYNGLAVNIQTPGTREVPVQAFLSKVSDNCGAVSNFRIRKSNGSPVPPSATTVSFDCSELGTQPVEIWASDQSGNWTRAETYVIVQDNTNGCGASPRPAGGRDGKPWPAWKDRK
jgi:hypothetical protein